MIDARKNLVDTTFDTESRMAARASMVRGNRARQAPSGWWIVPMLGLGSAGWVVIGLAIWGAL